MSKKIVINKNNGMYLPLFNLKGLKASITPFFGGSLSLNHQSYLLTPTSELELYHNTYGRNVIFKVNGKLYFLNGNTLRQQDDEINYEYGRLYQKVTRKNSLFSIITTSFIPENETVEVHYTEIINNSNEKLTIEIITNTLLYGRNANYLRDHRHVTSLLNRVDLHENGILLKPTLLFDEKGHKKNDKIYSIFASVANVKVSRMIPNVDVFLNGGTFNFPKGLENDQRNNVKDGYETMGAIGFEPFVLSPNESKEFVFTLGVHSSKEDAVKESIKYFNKTVIENELENVVKTFIEMTNLLQFKYINNEVSELLKWVSLQPVLRRHYGNSYLPHHDYGHGGRGWRDLWQDLLSLIMYNDKSVKNLLFNNFAGIRIDGSNATIIGDNLGEFKADRNAIVRVWSDHGAWPLLTVKMYLDETGDIDFLFLKQKYFEDQFTHYTYKVRNKYNEDNILRSKEEVYEGTIFEHLLLQNIVGFLNVGEKGFVKLEDADWNDGLDMAKANGETIAFTHFYINNLRELSNIIKLTNSEIVVFESLKRLLFNEISLKEYFNLVANFNDKQVIINKNDLIKQLNKLANDKLAFIKKNAWIKNHYQAYIDNNANFSDTNETVSLTGQTMALLSNTASIEQALKISEYTKEKLYKKHLGGYQLNSNYNKVRLDLGRAYGFAYGHKENGAVFSHMAMMYAYGLYQYNLVEKGREAYLGVVLKSLETNSNLLGGIPEYFNDQGIGMYPFLTGSATWLLKLIRTEVFGIKLNMGILRFEPKLSKEDFINGKATIKTYLFNQYVTVIYYNNSNLNFNEYKIELIKINGVEAKENEFRDINGTVEIFLN